jgi:transcriptional regulator with XRE-family HTH domain
MGCLAKVEEPLWESEYGDEIVLRFGRRLRALREQRGLSQARLATQFGVDWTLVNDIEAGRREVTVLTLHVMAAGFGISLSDLVRGL